MPFWVPLLVLGWMPMIHVLQLIPRVVGWRRIARRYPDMDEALIEEGAYRAVAVDAGWPQLLRGNPPHRVAWGRGGLRISTSLLPQRLYPAIFIPWSAISALEEKLGPLDFDGVKMKVAQVSSPLRLRFPCRGGEMVALLQKYWEAARCRGATPGKDWRCAR